MLSWEAHGSAPGRLLRGAALGWDSVCVRGGSACSGAPTHLGIARPGPEHAEQGGLRGHGQPCPGGACGLLGKRPGLLHPLRLMSHVVALV